MPMEQEELEEAYLIQLIFGFLEEVWALRRAQRGEGGVNWQTWSRDKKQLVHLRWELQARPGKSAGWVPIHGQGGRPGLCSHF